MRKRAITDVTKFIFISDLPEKADVILIPGTSKSAITERAAELYRDGYATYVLPSGMYSSSLGRFASENIDNPRYMGEYKTDFDYCRHILMENGVSESAILREDKATNSMENAMFSAQVLRELGITVKRAILCCQAFHARRAFLSYSCHFPGVELLVVPTDTQEISASDWYKTEKGFRQVMGEVAKCGKYFMDKQKELAGGKI